jgi:hypothetical protein
MVVTGEKIESRNVAALLAVVFMILLVEFFVAQRVPYPHDSRGNDYHWDGTYYVKYARSIDTLLFAREIDSYSLTRILPSTVVHIGFSILGRIGLASYPPGNETIFRGFIVLNGIAILVATLAWGDIARRLALTRFHLILGAAAFFVNFCFLKYNSFHPLGTDVVAFSLSMMMISRYLAQATTSLFLLSLLGAFTWPTLLSMGAILLALPYRQSLEPATLDAMGPSRDASLQWLSRGLTITLSILAIAAATGVAYGSYDVGYRPGSPAVAALSIAIVGLYVGLASAPLLDALPDVRNLAVERQYYLRRAGIVVALLAIVGILFYLLASDKAPRNTLIDFATHSFREAIRLPGIFLVAHLVFFGPIIALAVLKWWEACAIARRLGPAFVVAVLLTAAVALMSESRQLMGNIAFVVIPVIAAVQIGGNERRLLAIFLLTALVLSRVWVVFDPDALIYSVREYQNYPWQHFFGAMGPKMTFHLYVVHLAGFIAVLFVFYFGMRAGPRRNTRKQTAMSLDR